MKSLVATTVLALLSTPSFALDLLKDAPQEFQASAYQISGNNGFGLAYQRGVIENGSIKLAMLRDSAEHSYKTTEGSVQQSYSMNNIIVEANYVLPYLNHYGLSINLMAGVNYYALDRNYNFSPDVLHDPYGTFEDSHLEGVYQADIAKIGETLNYGAFLGGDIYGNYAGVQASYKLNNWSFIGEFRGYGDAQVKENSDGVNYSLGANEMTKLTLSYSY